MAELKGLSGKSYRTQSAPFAGGGEGDVYDVIGVPGFVAKVYKPDKRTKERERKLSVMVSNKPNVMEQYAWPLDVLYENGQFIGYVMPKINGKEKLRNIYVYDKRKGKPWSLYIAIAKNLSAAVHNVHEIHQVIGDLNPENILVNPNDGMVTLVDTDSYHISDGSRTYRCGVSMPEFVAPELQGIHFPSAPLPTFTPESDRFALAVLIFALLMNGAHPFSCKVISGSSSKFQPIDNIQNGKCAFFLDSRSRNMDIPRYAPDLSSLPENIQKLFRRAFVTGYSMPSLRPTAEEWYNALEQLEANLKTCLKDPQHIYYYGAKKCPWCSVNEKMHSISQSAFSSSSQPGATTGSVSGVGYSLQPATAGGQVQRFAPSSYRYTSPPSGSGVQNSGKRYGGWIALVVAVIALILIMRSCSLGTSLQTQTTTPQSSNQQNLSSISGDEIAVPSNPTEDHIYLRNLVCVDSNKNFITYDSVTDNYGTTYSDGLGGAESGENTWQEYLLDGTYKEIRGRVVLNYDTRTQTNEDVYLWIYGDGIALYMSQPVKAGGMPQDFTVDISDVTTLRVVIQGQSMLRLVDCALYRDSSTPTVSTATKNASSQQKRMYLSDLDWFNASSRSGAFEYFDAVKDNLGTTYANGIGGKEVIGQSIQEYRLDGIYSELRGRVVLNYDARTFNNPDVYLQIYGDGNLLFQSQEIVAGYEPQDFTVDLTGVTTLEVIINNGGSMLRLVDCILSQ